MRAIRTIKRVGLCLVIVLFLSGTAIAAPSIVKIGALQPTWTLGVFSAYVGPTAYDYVSPGFTTLYLGREAGIIKAGLTPDLTTCAPQNYCDEGLFAFKLAMTINNFAVLPLTYDVVNEYGTSPVWMTIEIDTGTPGVRTDNTTYQFMPTTNPDGWHTVDAAAGLWQQWTTYTSGITVGSLMTLDEVASLNTGFNVVRTYLRLGMGDSYATGANGTVAWVDKATIGGVTYDFVVKGSGYAQKDWSTNSGYHGFQNP